jgi:putative membrane protein
MASREPLVLLLVVGALFVVLGIAPTADRFTWFLENAPTLIAVPLLIASARRFPLTPLLYRLLAVHAIILMVGGHWTYAEVPAGDWVKDWLHLARNPYDRLGHLAQGFIPVILARELLLRHGVLRRGAWAVAVLLLVVLGISATYELIEWQTAVWSGAAAEAFLGTQGDPWDTQWDMACALVGGALSLLLLTGTHDRHLAALAPTSQNEKP